MTTETKLFVGTRLQLARNLRGVSLKDLASKVSSSARYLRRLETEDIQPKHDLRLALADALNVEPSFFSKQDERVEVSPFHFRKLKSTTKQSEAIAEAHAFLFDDLVTFFEGHVDFPQVNLPRREPDGENISSVDRIADHCRMFWGLGLDTPITNMCRVLEHSGVVVTEFDAATTKVDAFSWVGRRPIIVRSSHKESPSRARFDLGHELGHLVMHNGKQTGDDLSELQANRFASAFLMPKGAFIREFPRTAGLGFPWRELFEMKKRWKTSLQAIVRRAFDLDIIGAAAYRRANVYITKKGWKRQEPHEPPKEPADLVVQALSALYKERGLSRTQISSAIGVDCSVFKEFSLAI